jgi:hypothetical protein
MKLTSKINGLNEAIIQHTESGDYDYTDSLSIDMAAQKISAEIIKLSAGADKEKSIEDAMNEAYASLAVYTPEQIKSAAEFGYSWPVKFGYVEDNESNKSEYFNFQDNENSFYPLSEIKKPGKVFIYDHEHICGMQNLYIIYTEYKDKEFNVKYSDKTKRDEIFQELKKVKGIK